MTAAPPTIPPSPEALTAAARALADDCLRRGAAVAVAESCTGGWLAKCCTDLPGSSRWFERGVVAYSNAAKTELLGVDAALLARAGAVSEAVARAMATGLRARAGCARTCAITGVAGPGGAGEAVGTVWFCFAGAASEVCERVRFPGGREEVRAGAVLHALRGLADRCGR